jgi:hypothetical protein
VSTPFGDENAVCWRELSRYDDRTPGPWVEHCRTPTEEIGFPISEVSSYLKPGLVAVDQTLYAAYDENVDGRLLMENSEPIPVHLARWKNGAWHTDKNTYAGGNYPQSESVTAVGDGSLIVAYAAGDSESVRKVFVHRVVWPENEAQQWSDAVPFESPDPQSRPALWSSGNQVQIAWLETQAGDVHLARSQSADGGLTWSPVQTWGTRLLPNVTPVFGPDGTLAVGVLGDKNAEICTLSTEKDPVCNSVDSPALKSLYWGENGATGIVPTGEGPWELR